MCWKGHFMVKSNCILFFFCYFQFFFCSFISILLFILSTILPSNNLPCLSVFHLNNLNWEGGNLDVEIFRWDYRIVLWGDAHDNLGDFNAFQEENYSPVPWVFSYLPHLKSQLKGPIPDFRPAHFFISHPTVVHVIADGEAKKKIHTIWFCLFNFLFFAFNWKTQGAPSILLTNGKKFVPYFYCLFVPSCLLDQSFHSCDKQTDEWMDVSSFQLLIYKQTKRLFFKRKLYRTF